MLSDKPHVRYPLLVVVNSAGGKKRLVISFQYLNLYLLNCKFSYEDFKTALCYFENNVYLLTFDLKSGYHHVDVHEDFHKYLGFQWEGRYYAFSVLPFGLSTACFVFTKLSRPLVRYLRARGVRIVLYLDDGLVSVSGDLDTAKSISETVRQVVESAGFVINNEKSRFEPSTRASWLGYDIDLKKGLVSIPQIKIDNLKIELEASINCMYMPAKAIASITGRIMSMGLAIGDIARLRSRNLYAVLQAKTTWSDNVYLTTDARQELVFWLDNVDSYNGRSLWRAPSAVRVIYSDASDTGYGSYVVEHGGHVVHGQWSDVEAKKSSTWRELRAVTQTLRAIAHELSNHRVRWFSDNQNVVRIVQVGSRVEELQKEAVDIFKVAIAHNICLEPEWIPRTQNEFADYVSRIVDYDDWGLSLNAFALVEERWGPHTVDRFANDYNSKLPRFNSRFMVIGSEAVDAFTVSWRDENNYLCPPIYLIPRVLYHAQNCSCKGSLIVPEWQSAVFWPLLCDSSGNFVEFVTDFFYFPLVPGLFVEGKKGACLFRDGIPTSNLLALRIDFQSYRS
jgi:hypothetical protein